MLLCELRIGPQVGPWPRPTADKAGATGRYRLLSHAGATATGVSRGAECREGRLSARSHDPRHRGRRGHRWWRGSADIHALPERHIIPNMFRLGGRIGVGPCGVRIDGAVDGDGEISRGYLPGTNAGLLGRFKKISVDRLRREIVFYLDHDSRLVVGYRCHIPSRFTHNLNIFPTM